MIANNNGTSITLLRRAVAEDEDAWHQLVFLYGPLVQRWCHQSGLCEEDAADVFQDTFLTVANKLKDFRPQRRIASFRSWLKTIVRTKSIDHLRREGRQRTAEGGTDAQLRILMIADQADNEVEQDAAREVAVVVHRAMELIREEFEPRNWNAFEQVVLKQRTPADVASDLGVEPRVIRQANYRIRRRLRLLMEQHCVE